MFQSRIMITSSGRKKPLPAWLSVDPYTNQLSHTTIPLTTMDGVGRRLGEVFDVSPDGTVLGIPDPYTVFPGETYQGAVFFFNIETNGSAGDIQNQWVDGQIVLPSDVGGGANVNFLGSGLNIPSPGIAYIGSFNSDKTTAFIRRMADWEGRLVQTARNSVVSTVSGSDKTMNIMPLDTSYDYYCFGLPGRGAYGWVSSGTAYVRSVTGFTSTDALGKCVQLNSNGGRLVVSAPGIPGHPNSAVLAFGSSTDWTNAANPVTVISGTNHEKFGQSLAANSALNLLAIGAPGLGQVRIFTRSSNTWTQVQTIYGTYDFGQSLSMTPDGLYLLVGTPSIGRVNRYAFSSTQNQFLPDTGCSVLNYRDVGETSDSEFGAVVKLVMGGRGQLISAPNSSKANIQGGMVYSFR